MTAHETALLVLVCVGYAVAALLFGRWLHRALHELFPQDEGKVTPGIRRRGPIRPTWPQDPGEGMR